MANVKTTVLAAAGVDGDVVAVVHKNVIAVAVSTIVVAVRAAAIAVTTVAVKSLDTQYEEPNVHSSYSSGLTKCYASALSFLSTCGLITSAHILRTRSGSKDFQATPW